MADILKVGDRARVRGAEPVGTVEVAADGYVSVRYDHRPGLVSVGYYPVGHLEKVPELNAERSKPKATTKDILQS